MAKRRNAPVVNNGLYRNLHRQVNKDARAMKTVRDEGYGGVDSAVRSIYKNVASTQKGFSKRLDSHNERSLSKIVDHLANSRRANKRVTHAVNKQLNAFKAGPMMKYGNAQAVNTLERQARNDARVGNVGARSVGVVADTAQSAMNVIQAGTAEAQANAQALAAESYSQRTNEDLALISQQHHDITMAKIQAQQRMAELEKQHEYAIKQMKFQDKLADDALTEAGKGQVGLAKQQVRTAATVAEELYNRLAAGEDVNTILDDLVDRKLIDDADRNSGVINYLVRAAQTNQGKGGDVDNMAREVMFALQQMPAWAMLKPKQKDQLREYVAANVTDIVISKEKDAAGGSIAEFITGEKHPLTDDEGISGWINDLAGGPSKLGRGNGGF